MTDPLHPAKSGAESEDELKRRPVTSEPSRTGSVEDTFRPETLPAQLKRHRHSLAYWLTQTDHPERVFWLAVACYLFGLLMLTVATKGFLWFNNAWGIPFDGWLETAFTISMGIKNQWTTVALVQVVLWWQIRYPTRPPLWQACLLALVFCLVTNLVDYIVPGSWQMPLPLVGYIAAATLASFPIYLFWFRTLSILACFWLVRKNSSDATIAFPAAPRGWSIRGFFLVTLLSATLITIFRVGKKVLVSTDSFATEDGFLWVLSLWWLLECLVMAIIAVAVAWHCIRPNWWMLGIAIGAAVGFQLLGQVLAQAVATPRVGVTISYPGIWECMLSYIVTVFFHGVCFRLWRLAGFDLIGWIRGRGYRTRDGHHLDVVDPAIT